MEGNKNINVLIVDDEERFRNTTAKFLTKRGFNVETADGGEQAVERVKERDTDVVILDLRMQGMDGNQALSEMKKVLPDLEIIILTGHGSPESAFESLRYKAFDFLEKPCSLNILATRIREAYEKKKSISGKEAGLKEIMTPISTVNSFSEDQTVEEIIKAILEKSANDYPEHGFFHTPFLVTDKTKKIVGILCLTEIADGLKPPFMRLEKVDRGGPNIEHSAQSSLKGSFTVMSRYLAKRPVKSMINHLKPPVIEADATLMEATNRMLLQGARRMLVKENGDIVGLVSIEDLLFEFCLIINYMAD